MINNKWSTLLYAIFLCGAFGCSDSQEPEGPPEPVEPPVRELPTSIIENPAVWGESSDKIIVSQINGVGDDESYFFYLTSLGQKRSQIFGQTESESIRRDYTRDDNEVSVYVNDMMPYMDMMNNPVRLYVGGTDDEGIYASTGDLDRFGLSPFKISLAAYISFQDYKTQFTSISRANFLGEPLTDGDNYLIAGNGYRNGTAHPFVVTYNNRRYYQLYDSITTVTFFDQVGTEFLNIAYTLNEGMYVFGYDNNTNEIVAALYADVDVDKDNVHEREDSFKKVWERRLAMTIDKELFNVAKYDDALYIAGTVKTDNGDTAGKIISLNTSNGNILQDSVFDISDKDDGFYGIVRSGKNLFAFGYSDKVLSGNNPISSKGWALMLSDQGKPMRNHIYAVDGAVIEFTTACEGHEQNSFREEGYLAIGGYRKTGGQYAAVATQFYYRYKDY